MIDKEHKRNYMKEYRAKNPEIIRGIKKKYRENNVEKIKKQKKKYYENNLEKIKEYERNKRDKTKTRERTKLYREEYPEKVKESQKQWCKNNIVKIRERIRKWSKDKRKKDIKYNLNRRIGGAICACLKGNKAGRKWEILVGYSLEALMNRLLQTMPERYDWQDYLQGRLHIDHKIPISVFNFDRPENPDFKRCWALENLRLLPARENLIKRNYLAKPFQPALKIAYRGA